MSSVELETFARALESRLGGRGSVADPGPSTDADPLAQVRAEVEGLEHHLVNPDDVDFPVISELLRYVFGAGGKRLRPALVFLTARLGDADAERIRDLAAAVETLHAATLVHDDLVDGAMQRRGLPTVNVRWSAGATVLAGDWLFARAAGFAADTNDLRTVKIFARALGTLTNGELRQLFGRSGVPDYEEYAYRIYAKTASLFEAATEATARLIELPEDQVLALASYGRALGSAFQIIDDLLDFVGDPGRLGKPVGNDLRSGQVTLPVMLHLERHPDVAPWLRIGGDVEPPKGAIDALVDAVRNDACALSATRAHAKGLAADALRSLEVMPDGEARGGLARLAEYIIERDS